MKKLIIFFFMVALVGCNSTSTLILDSPMIEEEICVDDCVTSKAEIYPYFVDYHSRLEEIKDEIAPERNSSSINQFYSTQYMTEMKSSQATQLQEIQTSFLTCLQMNFLQFSVLHMTLLDSAL